MATADAVSFRIAELIFIHQIDRQPGKTVEVWKLVCLPGSMMRNHIHEQYNTCTATATPFHMRSKIILC